MYNFLFWLFYHLWNGCFLLLSLDYFLYCFQSRWFGLFRRFISSCFGNRFCLLLHCRIRIGRCLLGVLPSRWLRLILLCLLFNSLSTLCAQAFTDVCLNMLLTNSEYVSNFSSSLLRHCFFRTIFQHWHLNFDAGSWLNFVWNTWVLFEIFLITLFRTFFGHSLTFRNTDWELLLPFFLRSSNWTVFRRDRQIF